MKRAAGLLIAVATASGCVSTGTDGIYAGRLGGAQATVKDAVGPWGQPVPVMAGAVRVQNAYTGMGSKPPVAAAQPGGVVQASYVPAANPGEIMLASGGCSGCQPSPNAAGPTMPYGVVYAQGGLGTGGPMGPGVPPFPPMRSQIRFVGPAGAQVAWFLNEGGMVPYQVDVPGRFNFMQAAIYRLKLSNIPGRPGVELYPTIEVVPAHPKTDAFLAHNYIPVDFTEEDFDQVAAGNFITKVIYLPDPDVNCHVSTGIEELVSTRLEPGVDPIAEAHRRGHVLLVIRLGGIDLETANSPAMDAGPRSAAPAMPAYQGQLIPGTPQTMPPVPALQVPPAASALRQSSASAKESGEVQPALFKTRRPVFMPTPETKGKTEEVKPLVPRPTRGILDQAIWNQ